MFATLSFPSSANSQRDSIRFLNISILRVIRVFVVNLNFLSSDRVYHSPAPPRRLALVSPRFFFASIRRRREPADGLVFRRRLGS